MNPAEISYRIRRDPPVREVFQLYRLAGWLDPDDTEERIRKLISGSFCFCCACAPDGSLIGMMRALSDGVSDAYLLDLIVVPEYRRNGIGRQILDRLTCHLRSSGVNWIVLIGAPGTQKFYGHTDFAVMQDFTPYRSSPEGK